MGAKLLPYVSKKFTDQQVRFISNCLRNGTPIQVHGVYEEHLTDCLRTHGFRQRDFKGGSLRLDRIHKSVNDKLFNFERPFFINCIDKNDSSVALFITFPSKEYLCQSAELLFAFVKLNLQLIFTDASNEALGLKDEIRSRFDFEPDEARELLANFLSSNQVTQFHYPAAFEAFPSWSGLEQAANTGLIHQQDIVVVGYVDKLCAILVAEYGYESLQSDAEGRRFLPFGPKGLFGATVLVSKNSGKRVVLLGFTHSFWGSTAAKIASVCLRAGASHFVYVAKAGTRTGRIRPTSDGDPNKHFLCLIGGQYLVWEGEADNPGGRVREVALKSIANPFLSLFTGSKDQQNASRCHLSVPTVVGEDHRQFQAYGAYSPSSIDNEIAFIAEEVGKIEEEFPDREYSFSCMHFITDLVVSNQNFPSSADDGLDNDHQAMPEKSAFWKASAGKLAIFIESHGVIEGETHLSFDRLPEYRNMYFDRYERSEHLTDAGQIHNAVERPLEVLSCYPRLENELKLEEIILRGTKGSSYQFLGEAGSGKSVLAENLYFFLRTAYARNDYSFQPYYIDITSYEKDLIQSTRSASETWASISDKLTSAIKDLGPIAIIFDGIDEQSPFKSEIVDFLRSRNKPQREKDCVLIFFKRVYRNVVPDHGDRERILGVDIGIDSSFEIGSLAHSDGRVVGVKENLIRLLALTSGTEEGPAKELTSRISSWPDFSFNLRLLNLVREVEIRNDSEFDGPTHFFHQFSVEYLKKYASGIAIDDLKRMAAEASYGFLIEGKAFPIGNPEEVLVKRLSTQSMEMLCYLTARHLDVCIFEGAGYSDERVFPHLINKYSKELLRERDQDVALSKLLEILHSSTSGIRLKSFATYLLGRIDGVELGKLAVEALEAVKRELAVERNSNEERELLIFDRSLNISLIYLGQDSRDYIRNLMNSKRYDEINRGFHLAYYGDIDYFSAPDMLGSDDGICRFDRSAANLLANLWKVGLDSNLVNLSAYTLYSLAQSRLLQRGSLGSVDRKTLVSLAQNNLLKRKDIHQEVKQFVRNCVQYLQSDLNPDAFAFSKIARLKTLLRAGWNDTKLGRSVEDSESILSHIGSAVYLAVAYLPEDGAVTDLVSTKALSEDYLAYRKDIIIRMLAVHDIGEYDLGDIASPHKTEEDLLTERRSMSLLAMLWKGDFADPIGDYSDTVWGLWSEFEQQDSVNAKVARDIDLLECLAQLCQYSLSDRNRIDDFEDFKNKLLDGLTTKIGKHLSLKFSRSTTR